MKRFSRSLVLAAGVAFSAGAAATDLMDIYKLALMSDPLVQQAKAQYEYYLAGVDVSRAALLPQIDVVGSLGYTNYDDSPSTTSRISNTTGSLGVSLSQVLWKHSSWIQKSIAEKQAVRYDLAYKDAMQNLIIRVCNAYFGVLQAHDTLMYNQANQAALKRQLDEANRQFQVGVIAETDRLEAQSAYDLSSAQVIAAENSLINSYESIRALTGQSFTIEDLAKLDTGKFSTPKVQNTLAALLKLAEDNNLALQGYIIDRDIARDSIALAETGHEPVVSLEASANAGRTHYNKSNTSHFNSWSQYIGLNLSVPIYHGGQVTAEVSQAQAKYVSASQELERQHRNLVTNVNNNYNNISAAISSVKAYDQSVKSANSALEATRAGYEVGTRTMTDVLDATQSLYNAMQRQAASRYNYILSRLQLNYTDGSLKVEHVDEINRGLAMDKKGRQKK